MPSSRLRMEAILSNPAMLQAGQRSAKVMQGGLSREFKFIIYDLDSSLYTFAVEVGPQTIGSRLQAQRLIAFNTSIRRSQRRIGARLQLEYKGRSEMSGKGGSQ